MTFDVRIATVALAAFAGLNLAASLAALLLSRHRGAGPAAARASRLARIRLLPASAGTIGSGVVMAAFLVFEPRVHGEGLGSALPVLAVVAAAMLAGSLWRGFALLRTTHVTTRAWLAGARPVRLDGINVPAFVVTTDFPIVTVIGFRRPRLLIARSVMESCTAGELEAILAHEQGHIDRRDNLTRLLLGIAPDCITWLPLAGRMLAEWRAATEDAADDEAVRCGSDGTLHLAQALVKVARLVPRSGTQAEIPAAALYRGEDLERRVRRLLAQRDPAAAGPSRAWLFRFATVAAIAVSVAWLENVHGLVEGLIHRLP